MRTEFLVAEALLTQANVKASAGDWESADEMLLQAAAVLDRVLAVPVAPAIALLPADVVTVETPEEAPRAMAAAA